MIPRQYSSFALLEEFVPDVMLYVRASVALAVALEATKLTNFVDLPKTDQSIS